MGTRSVTIFLNGDDELCRVYRQFDGYPEGMGVDLAKLCNVTVVNGFSGKSAKEANGMGCLAAQVIAGLKDGVGNVYIEPTGGEIGDWVEYVYTVRGMEGKSPVISCATNASGAWPFNMQEESRHVFTGTSKEWLAKYAKKRRAS